MDTAWPLVHEFEPRDVHPQTGAGRRAAASNVEFQQGSRAPSIRSAPAAGREFRTRDGIRREDRVATPATDVLLLAECLVEVNHAVKGQIVNQNQVVSGSTAAHGEVGEFAVGYQPRQAVKRSQYVTARARGTAQLLSVQQGVAHCPMRIGNFRAGYNYDFLERLRAGEHLEVERSHLAADYTHAGFAGCHQARANCRYRIEPDVEIAQFDNSVGLRATGNDLTVAVGHGHSHALKRPLCLHTDYCNAHPAICALRHRGKWPTEGQRSCENLNDPFHFHLFLVPGVVAMKAQRMNSKPIKAA